MPKKAPAATKTTPATAVPKRDRRAATRKQPIADVSHEEIRLRAYEFYLQRDAAPGDPVADWLRAERELAAELTAGRRA
jgi:DUF2934 family protein